MTEAKSSPMTSLRDRKKQILESLHIDLAVPRWSDPELFIRYTPVALKEVEKAGKAVERAKAGDKSEASINANMDVLIRCHVGIYAVISGEKYCLDPDDPERWVPFDPDASNAEWTRIDETLAKALGVEDERARAVCRELFNTELDIVAQASRLVEWSGAYDDEARERFEGE